MDNGRCMDKIIHEVNEIRALQINMIKHPSTNNHRHVFRI
jgi:hypothetical protein